MAGKFYIVGVGPGDPELMTIKAYKNIKNADIIAYPGDGRKEGTAYQIACKAIPEVRQKKTIYLKFPMTRDEKQLEKSHDNAANDIINLLNTGKDVSMITLGDPCIYSTAFYVFERIESKGYETEIINGINSYSAAAAKSMISLAMKDEKLIITTPEQIVTSFDGTMVIMKSGYHLKELKKMFRDRKMYLIENCGMENENLFSEEIPDKAGYFSTLIIKSEKT
ncbi:precorrin-2 C(20)-methyltransferase [Oribacterium sp. WCC10]|uniref:precorrin-2 C(20)-methyltransferase n=1 Tax=Oribacterium sp. WCC10 TaxID=1855343 RepID=UPI0008ECBEC2|nr:precorrin-2 C(20)-methyltransferase [Oribacterium sp. WCC10]SFG68762.1 precorrin-2/cobalt-factor-2 C20-methyltransferase [Oribacterium sp. WCC10]